MPNYNQTGPAGQGPMTGQKLGVCSGGNQQSNASGFIGRGMGRGLGFGRGRGCRGMGFSGNPVLSLEEREKMLENKLTAVRQLKKKSNSKK